MGETVRGGGLSRQGFIDGAQGMSSRIARLACTAATRQTQRLGHGRERRVSARCGEFCKRKGGTWPNRCHRAPR